MSAGPMSSVIRIGKLLTERDVEFIDEPLKLKCLHCKSILYNPCRLACNCKYCRQCIDEMVASGKQLCPGDSEFCQSANLSQFLFDCKTSSKILKLRVKCPEQLCSQECQLVELEEHLKRCAKKSMSCPFSDMGCETENMVEEKLRAHFEAEVYNHNMMLIEMIDNLKNEISSLKKEVMLKDGHIESITADVQQARQLHDSMLNEINSMKAEFQSLTSDNVATQADIESIKTEMKEDVLHQFDTIIEEVESKWQQAIQKRDYKDEEIANTMKEVKDRLADYDMRMGAVNDCLNRRINADFVWFTNCVLTTQSTVSGISHLAISRPITQQTPQNVNTLKYSDCFLGKPRPYKFRLALQNHVDDHLMVVHLDILTGQSDATLTWPFRGNVTINIMNMSRPKICKSLSRHCQIEKVAYGSSSSSDRFIFDYSDWNKAGIAIGNDMVVSCSVVED